MRVWPVVVAVALATVCARAGSVPAPPRIVDVSASSTKIGRFERLELTVRLAADYANPFNPEEVDLRAQVADPEGHVRSVNGFVYQDFERTLEDGREVLSAKGERLWKIRYAPMRLGLHRYHVEVRTPGGLAAGPGGTFQCVPSKSPGFIGVSQRNPRYFAFSTGRPYFPIGHNVCWADSQLKTYDYEQYFRAMAGNEENFTRIWMCSWSLELEGKKLDDYRLDNAWRLDHIFEFARLYGIYVKLCFDNFYDFTQKRHSPYWKANGGMCSVNRDFFVHEQARLHYRRRLRYITARWGYSTQLMAWEFWNEMDYAPSKQGKVLSQKEPYMLEWTSEMASEIRRLDPFGHSVTNTLAAYTDWPEFWILPATDFVQLHLYIHEGWEPTPKQYDTAALVLDQARDFQQYQKPFLIAEFGFQPHAGRNRRNVLDRNGIHLHNALWASCLSGAAGAPMLWWWDNYVEPHDLYYHYRALGRFLKGVDWLGKTWVPLRDGGHDHLRMVGLRTHTEALLWFQDSRNTWHRLLEKKEKPQLLQRFSVRVPGIRPGQYRLEWFDTYNGGIITVAQATADEGGLTVELSHLVRAPDVACRVTPYVKLPERRPSW